MNTTPIWSHTLAVARQNPDGQELANLLDGCRAYLMLIARQEWPAGLQAKESPSDLVQQTLTEAFEGFADFKGTSHDEWLGWVRRILFNNLHNFAKYYRRQRRDVAREVSPDNEGASLRCPDLTPRSRLEQAELAALIDDAMSQLPERYQSVIRLRHEQDLPFAEVGQRLGCSAEAAQKLWGRAVKELAVRLRRHQ